MRHLSALLACSLAAMTVMASAKDAPASASAAASAPMSASARAAAMKTLTESVKGKEVKAPVAVAPTAREKEEAAEVDLSERIAARLAEMRATQAARAAAPSPSARPK